MQYRWDLYDSHDDCCAPITRSKGKAETLPYVRILRSLCGEPLRIFFYPTNLIPDGMAGPEIHWLGIVLFMKLGDIQFDRVFPGDNAGHYA